MRCFESSHETVRTSEKSTCRFLIMKAKMIKQVKYVSLGYLDLISRTRDTS